MTSSVTIYTKPGCPYCAAAKQHYAEQGIQYQEISIKDNPKAQQELLKLSGGRKVVPVLIENGELRVGFGGS